MTFKKLMVPFVVFSWIITGFAMFFIFSNFSSVMKYTIDASVADNY